MITYHHENVKLRGTRLVRGFTLVEVLVTLGITLLLTSLMVIYGRSGEQQIILLRDQARIVSTILRAKSLAIQAYNADSAFCGYGAHFEPNGTFLIFKDIAPECSASDNRYSGSAETIETGSLEARLGFEAPLGVSDVLFIPPDPQVIINGDANVDDGLITLIARKGNSSVEVKINSAGQVSTN